MRRGLADTVGFAHRALQIEAVARRIDAQDGGRLAGILRDKGVAADDCWRFATAPHDDYAYAGFLYPLVLRNIASPVVIIFGVAHKARQLRIEDRLVFDTFKRWSGPYGDIAVSPVRERILAMLPQTAYLVSGEMQRLEHSVEAMLPFLQHCNRGVEFVPILVPAMSFARMDALAREVARALAVTMSERQSRWGEDIALIASTDAVHYGDEGWDGRNFATFGVDVEGYRKAVAHEHRIISEGLGGDLSDNQRIDVDDLDGMGVTAPATLRHWVGYAAIGFR